MLGSLKRQARWQSSNAVRAPLLTLLALVAAAGLGHAQQGQAPVQLEFERNRRLTLLRMA